MTDRVMGVAIFLVWVPWLVGGMMPHGLPWGCLQQEMLHLCCTSLLLGIWQAVDYALMVGCTTCHGCVSAHRHNGQLLGKVHCSHACLMCLVEAALQWWLILAIEPLLIEAAASAIDSAMVCVA